MIFTEMKYQIILDLRRIGPHRNEDGFGIGVRCIVHLNEGDKNGFHYAYIQDMDENKGPVTIFIEDIGEK